MMHRSQLPLFAALMLLPTLGARGQKPGAKAPPQEGPRIESSGSVTAANDAPEIGADRAARAAALGIQWLLAHQDKSGRWDSDDFTKHDPENDKSGGAGIATHDIGATGLATLCLLHAKKARTEYRPAIDRALAWLMKQQDDKGLIGVQSHHGAIYGHAIATLALCVHAGRLAGQGKPDLRKSAQRALDHLAHRRNPYRAWRYYPKDGDNDTSVTYWCVSAYEAGRAAGLNVEPQGLMMAREHVASLTDAQTGRVGYSRRGEASARGVDQAESFPANRGEAMTAAGLCMQSSGRKPKTALLERGMRLLAKKPPVAEEEARDFVYWYLGTEAMRRAPRFAGIDGAEAREVWHRALHASALATQERKGSKRGSWAPTSAWGHYGGRISTTAFVVRALQTSAEGVHKRTPRRAEKRKHPGAQRHR